MRYASDEREHRRGLILGLTMAEILLLLLFLLLLALSAMFASREQKFRRHEADLRTAQLELNKARQALEALGPILGNSSDDKESVRKLVDKLVDDISKMKHVNDDNERLRSELDAAKHDLANWHSLEAEARRFNPDDPPVATLRRGLEGASALRKLEADAAKVDPRSPPAATLRKGLENLRTGTEDAKVGTRVREEVAVLRTKERELQKKLQEAVGPKLERWGADFDPSSLTLRFRNPELLFEQGSSTLRPKFAANLNELFPDYLRILYNFKDDIEEVRIEGHTSSEWSQGATPLQAYFGNMSLSQDRTRAVLEYGLMQTRLPNDLVEWARNRITANGLSSSRLLHTPDGSEDREMSRRVEFRVLMKSNEKILKIVDPVQ